MDVDLSEAMIDEAVGQMPESFSVSMTPRRKVAEKEERKKDNSNFSKTQSSVASKIPGSSIKTQNHSKGMGI